MYRLQDARQCVDEVKRGFVRDQQTTEFSSAIAKVRCELNQGGDSLSVLFYIDRSNNDQEQVLDLFLLREVHAHRLGHAAVLEDLEDLMDMRSLQNSTLCVNILLIHEVNEGFILMIPLEVVPQLIVVNDKGVQKLKALCIILERLDQRPETIFSIEVQH